MTEEESNEAAPEEERSELGWDTEERDRYMAEHDGEPEPETETLVEADE